MNNYINELPIKKLKQGDFKNMVYGIKTIEKDSTPGFRDYSENKTWFSSKEERDKKYTDLTSNDEYTRSPKDTLLEQNDSYLKFEYEKIEK